MTTREIGASVTLENRDDRGSVRVDLLTEANVRRTTTEAMTPTTAMTTERPPAYENEARSWPHWLVTVDELESFLIPAPSKRDAIEQVRFQCQTDDAGISARRARRP
ncbi:MAG: hypothetical protein OXG35_19380 [Acidobacteria bacterium]|nr:hypothetical protein [Acidobacteriota bacterium]